MQLQACLNDVSQLDKVPELCTTLLKTDAFRFVSHDVTATVCKELCKHFQPDSASKILTMTVVVAVLDVEPFNIKRLC